MRTHYCGQISKKLLHASVSLCGWVHRRRDHGGVIFIDLRDRTGLAQIVFRPESAGLFASAEQLRSEYVIQVQGIVTQRPVGQENPNLASGEVEVIIEHLVLFSRAAPLPFPLDEYSHVSEEVRLTHRYLDLRRSEMQERLITRYHITKLIRKYLDHHGFLDIETPFLTRATPEGARDYLVPSRTHRGQFFALPQSPQLFKQILMMSGFDRYFQIVRCFRDEDLRADRQPEFTQLDLEMSFVTEEEVMAMTEGLIHLLFKEVLNVNLPNPFPRMSYTEAMSRFGSDKPDLRIPLELTEITDLVKNVDFQVFSTPANHKRGRVAALKVPEGIAKLSRKAIDEYTQFVAIYGAKGLAYIKVSNRDAGIAGLQSPLIKFLPETTIEAILKRTQAQTGDIIFFGADDAAIVAASLGALRTRIGHDLKLYTCEWAPLWVTEFPMFEEENGQWQAKHHPFTSPAIKNIQDLETVDKHTLLSRAYDMVLNGYEIGGGSIRIHDADLHLYSVLYYLTEVCGSEDQVHQFLSALIQELPEKEPIIMTYGEQLRQEGRQQGMQQGVEQGAALRNLEIARNMLEEGVEDAVVQKITKLSFECLLKLKEEALK